MFPNKGYFFLKSLKTGFVLDNNGKDQSGAELVLDSKGDENKLDRQLWTYENGHLVSKNSSLVVDIEGGDLKTDKKVLQYDRKKTNAHNQKWGFRDGFVYAVADPKLVLSAKENHDNQVTVTRRLLTEDNIHQQWDLELFLGDY